MDTRHLLHHLTSRKAQWDEMALQHYHLLTADERAALHQLPLLTVSARSGAFDPNPAFAQAPLEKLVCRAGAYYYVNSEGYDYARYGFRIVDFPAVLTVTLARCGCRAAKTHRDCLYCGNGGAGTHVCGRCREEGIDGPVIRGTERRRCAAHKKEATA